MKAISISLLILFFTIPNVSGQTVQQQQMKKLDFLIGDWVGVSVMYEDGAIAKQVPAYEKISYELDKSIITIDLKSESLQLHTVIYYDETDKTYYYNSYYKTGAGRYKAALLENKFVVTASPTKRFIFHRTPEGNFQEYGEKLINDEWVKYFEDNFKRVE